MRSRDEVLREFDAPSSSLHTQRMADRIRELEEDRENGAQWFDAYQRLENALWDAVGLDHVPEPDSNGHPNTVNLACVAMLRDRIRELEADAKRYRFLRDGDCPLTIDDGNECYDGAKLDAAIDAAMTTEVPRG